MLRITFTTLLFTSVIFNITGLCQETSPNKINEKKTLNAIRVDSPPKINGVLDDDCWKNANTASNFLQYDPYHGRTPSFKTEIKVLYDDYAVYVGAFMRDPNPDSIYLQIGSRDNFDLNSDYLYLSFDTYNQQQDAYSFGVTASGVQRDGREADWNFSAVWESSVKIIDSGWIAEFRIPYSALRFPKTDIQTWGINFFRGITRFNEENQWSLVEKGSENILNYWGRLTGLESINPPPRISAAPYLSAGIQKNEDGSTSSSYNGGMDLKWGLNESFTLDMILMPDFSQVKSDNTFKNLSPFELEYDDKRPFFNEGIDLFQKGSLFYSRRIGRTPLKYNSAYGVLEENEIVHNNPLNAQLINALKISGRNKNGLGVGVLNAITGNTNATIRDTITGEEREFLTDPVTNYNMLVVNQNMKNNSSFYITNTNVWRPSGWKRSNVTAAGLTLANKTSTYQVSGDFSLSQNITPSIDDQKRNNTTGLLYKLEFRKIKGKFQFKVNQGALSKTYNRNDMGLNLKNDYMDRVAELSYNSYTPGKIFNRYSHTIGMKNSKSLSTNKNIATQFYYKLNTTLLNYWKIRFDLLADGSERHDFYETRKANIFVIKPGYTILDLYLSSDSRKKVSFSGQLEVGDSYDNKQWLFYWVNGNFRLNDRFNISPEISMDFANNDKGWVNQVNNDIIFGNRDVQTMTNSFAAEYMINNKISLNLWVRHYWSRAIYDDFYTLTPDGLLAKNNEYRGSHNFNYNSFNLDLVFGWEFAPGSMINIVWKNAIMEENNDSRLDYFDNFDKLTRLPQTNSLSFKVLYYLDYQMLKKKLRV